LSDRLTKSIYGAVGGYFALQGSLFLSFALAAGFFVEYAPLFFGVSIAFHLFILFLLLVFKEDFVKESTGERLERVNLANLITLFRLSTLPTILFLVLAARDYRIRVPLLVLVLVVFASDFADGYVSRKAGEVTKVGRMMDSASDYSLLIVLTVVFHYFRLIPRWLFVLVVARLGFQVALMGILIAVKRRIEPKTTFLGKAAVATIMVLYAAEVLRLIFGLRSPLLVGALEWAVGAVVAVSIADKAVAFLRSLGEPPPPA
jgi:phosphatidylglycerophosphate synthase